MGGTFVSSSLIHWNPKDTMMPTLLALSATEIVIMTILDTSSGDRVITMTTFGFKLIMFYISCLI